MSQNPTSTDIRVFKLGPVVLQVATQAGPRIVGYKRRGGPQSFASLPNTVLRHRDIGVFRFLGGHRLWRSPEVPSSTYYPDDTPVEIATHGDGIAVEGQPDLDGIVKTLSISQVGSYTIVDHRFDNVGRAAVRAAPWAITQLSPGGRAILPEPRDPVDADGVLPNKCLVVWPYTDLSASEIQFSSDAVIVRATANETKSKVGIPNSRGWLAYVLGSELFVKWAPLHDATATYTDLGASAQCYRDERFIEIETLGPLVNVEPGSSVTHREVWQLIPLGDEPFEHVLASLPAAPEGIEL